MNRKFNVLKRDKTIFKLLISTVVLLSIITISEYGDDWTRYNHINIYNKIVSYLKTYNFSIISCNSDLNNNLGNYTNEQYSIRKKVYNNVINSRERYRENGQISNSKDEWILENRYIDINKPMIAITFDDGPSSIYTPRVLKTLKENNSVATFYLIGNRVEDCKDIIKEAIDSGNEIGNHSYTHKLLDNLSQEELYYEINETQNKIYSVVGKYPKTMRPTYGSVSNKLKDNDKLPLINWTIDTEDWKTKNTELIINEILSKVKDGDVILMHDIYKTTADAVDIVVPKLINRGFQLVTVSELYRYKDIELKSGKVYYGMEEQ